MAEKAPQRALTALVTGLVALYSFVDATPSHAELGRIVTVRRTLGLAFLGGSAALTMKGMDWHQEADDFYDEYKMATDQEEIARLYQRTTNRDVKAQVSWAMAAAFGISGLRLILTRGEADVARPKRANPTSMAPSRPAPPRRERALALDAVADGRKVGVQLRRRFF